MNKNILEEIKKGSFVQEEVKIKSKGKPSRQMVQDLALLVAENWKGYFNGRLPNGSILWNILAHKYPLKEIDSISGKLLRVAVSHFLTWGNHNADFVQDSKKEVV
jgi:hypothetical protein